MRIVDAWLPHGVVLQSRFHLESPIVRHPSKKDPKRDTSLENYSCPVCFHAERAKAAATVQQSTSNSDLKLGIRV